MNSHLRRGKQRIIDLFSVIDWMMQIPINLQKQLWQDIEQLERNRTMPYITSVERIGIEKGEAIALQRLLIKRFGGLPAEITRRITEASQDQIENWLDLVFEAPALDSIFTDNGSASH